MDARILAALKYIEQDLSEQIELEEVSRKIGLSKFYFERLFHAEVGESFYAYLKRVRLHHAARRLKRTSQSVYEIAVAYGYTSNATFSRAFQRFFGVSPTRYRKELWGREDSFDDPPKIEIREIKPYYCILRDIVGLMKEFGIGGAISSGGCLLPFTTTSRAEYALWGEFTTILV